MYSIILGSGNLGVITHHMLKSFNETQIRMYGYANGSRPSPFYLGMNEITKSMFGGQYVSLKVSGEKAVINKDGFIQKSEDIKMGYRRSKIFKRDNQSKYVYDMDSPLDRTDNFMKKMSLKSYNNWTKGYVLSMTIDKSTKSAEIIYNIFGKIRKDSFHFDNKSSMFITIPVDNISIRKDHVCILFTQPEEFNKDSKQYNHIYQYDISIPDNKAGQMSSFFNPYCYIEDHFFKNPYLKRIIPLYNKERMTFRMQFISKKSFNALNIISVGSKIQQMEWLVDKCPVIEFFSKIGVEMKYQNRALLKFQRILKEEYNTLIVGRFAMQDHSRLSDNIETIYKNIS